MSICYPDFTDWGCLPDEELALLDPEIKARAEMLAWTSLVRLTGQRLSICPIVLRPCAARCDPSYGFGGFGYYGGSYAPYISGGRWYNACGCNSGVQCECTSQAVVKLPGEAHGPVVVRINGAALDPSAYRIDNSNLLVRTDGEGWPLGQNVNSPEGDAETFSISYYSGMAPDDNLAYAAGLLALEWYKSCTGKECRLPAGATNVQRQGISFTIPAGAFEDGLSGIREVDAITGMYNPHRLKTPSRIMSPDRSIGRMTA